jgi:hypothetical protein
LITPVVYSNLTLGYLENDMSELEIIIIQI